MADDSKPSRAENLLLAAVAAGMLAMAAAPFATLELATATAVGPKATVPDCPERFIYFSPGPEPQAAILREIAKAREEILVQAYSFTSKPISDALIDRQRWGVKVKVLLDRTNANPGTSKGDECVANGISVAIDHDRPAEPISHAKILIIDKKVGIFGSYNLSDQAMRNSEVLVVEHDPDVVRALVENWELHAKHSRQLAAPFP